MGLSAAWKLLKNQHQARFRKINKKVLEFSTKGSTRGQFSTKGSVRGTFF